MKVGIINERGEGVNEAEIRDIFFNILKTKIKELPARKRFYNNKRPTVEEVMTLAGEVYDETLGIAKRRAVVRRKRIEL